MIKNQSITIKEISNVLDITEKIIKRDIASLKRKKLINRQGSKKGGKWIVMHSDTSSG